ncbi:hypothetical protein P154DRAFT_621882 [Amniculicola lignicola CBS 123094]|uniref:G domain-containing protein n=1 Tax=Amniculicola lignicola CBS 123094 TaxID=1392246 RepID=A0A6A5W9C1_9PLEO|nr:hypothetical protein P154DRAFT_621882 [Amniculicola lignicola CBS 123094]
MAFPYAREQKEVIQQPTPSRPSESPPFEPACESIEEKKTTLVSTPLPDLVGQSTVQVAPQVPEAMFSGNSVPLTNPNAVKETESGTNVDLGSSFYISKLRELHESAQQRLDGMTGTATSATSGSTLTPTIPRKRKASEMGTDFPEEDGDDADEGDENMCVKPHKPELETLPRLPIYHPAFALAEETAQRTLKTFIAYIKGSGYEDDEAIHLLQELQQRSHIPYGNAVRIGLIGEAGVGKSSTINSILGVANLTVEACNPGDDGDSCTYVVIEFRQASPNQLKPFGAEIEFFARETCLQMVTDLFKKYMQYRKTLEESPDEVTETETEVASTARECFQQLFSNHPEFSDEATADEFLSSATSATDPVILNRLLKWTKNILCTFVPDGKTTLTIEANTAAGLVERFLPFTRTVPYREFNGLPLNFSPWPLVRLVRVCIDSPILKQGIVLADLPGLSDINRFRVDASLRYMQNCDVTIVVAKIDRPEKSASLKKYIMEAFRRRRSGSVIVAITRSDDVNLEGKTNFELDPNDEERLAAITQNHAALDKMVEAKRAEIRANMQSGKRKMNKKLNAQIRMIQKRKKALTQERLEVRVAARNKKVAATIAQNYRMDTRDDARVPIFCISNKAYMHHIRGYELDAPPAMGLVETQVPTMRAHIYALPSIGKFGTLDYFCNNSMHMLLSVIQMSCSTSTLTRKEHLLRIVNKANHDIGKEITRLVRKYLSTEVAVLLTGMTNEGQGSMGWNFSRSARALCAKYAKYPPSGHRAFVRNRGHYKTKKVPEANWNDEFLLPVRSSLDQSFGKLHDECEVTLKAEVAQAIKEIMASLNLQLRDDPQALVCNAYKDCFLSNLPRHEADIAREIEGFAKGLQRYFRIINRRTTTTGDNSYIDSVMKSIYANSDIRAPTQKGMSTHNDPPSSKSSKTLHKSRCEVFESHVTAADGPFHSLSSMVDSKLNQALSQSEHRLQNGVGMVFDQIRRAFDVMSQRRDNDSVEGQRFRRELHGLVEEGRKIVEGPVRRGLEACRGFK